MTKTLVLACVEKTSGNHDVTSVPGDTTTTHGVMVSHGCNGILARLKFSENCFFLQSE